MSATRQFSSLHDVGRLAAFNLLLLGGAVAALCVRLWPEWRHNPDLSHGILMPVVFALLINEARRGSPRFVRDTLAANVAFAGLLVLSIASLFAAGLYAASVDWSHPLVNLSLTVSAVLLMGAGLIVYAGAGTRLIGFNWSALVAALLWLLCTPIPPGTYSKLTLTLQLWISESVLRTLHVLGIPAIRHGNIIELARATVGVEEACSGVRSLISCVFAAFFFSATLVRRPWARALVIALSAPLALVMNFLRSLVLTLLSNNGVDITGLWHDLTGFAVLGITAGLLVGVAIVLDRTSGPRSTPTEASTAARPAAKKLIALTGTLGLAAALVLFCVANTQPSVRQDSPVPNLDGLLPNDTSGWTIETSQGLFQFRDTLQTDHLAQRIYRKAGPDGQLTEVILYAAYWRAGQAPVSLVASHTPDACWPGSGWASEPASARESLNVGGRQIPEAEHRVFRLSGFPQHVWFWHIYDGRPIAYRDPYSPTELLRIAWKYGFRHDGDQLFVRVSSNRPWSELSHEPLFADFFARTKALGL